MSSKGEDEFSSYLTEAIECVNDALQLTCEEKNSHLTNGFWLLGYIHLQLHSLNKVILAEILEYYNKARWCSPKIHINVIFIPPGFSDHYKVLE